MIFGENRKCSHAASMRSLHALVEQQQGLLERQWEMLDSAMRRIDSQSEMLDCAMKRIDSQSGRLDKIQKALEQMRPKGDGSGLDRE